MKTVDLEIAVAKHFRYLQNIIVPNVMWGFFNYGSESDLLVLTTSGYLYEVELKISLADLKNDFKKKRAHQNEHLRGLFYAMPEKMYEKALTLIPYTDGILLCDESGRIKQVRKPVCRNAEKLTLELQAKLARLGTIRYWTYKIKEERRKKGENTEEEKDDNLLL